MLAGKIHKVFLFFFALVLIAGIFIFSTHKTAIDFNTEVKPIINKKCIICHGGVRRQGNFSLLFRSEALGKTKSGKYGIVPGDPDHSEMIRRIQLKDPEERMPYHHEPLSETEISILTKWVKQGAPWGNHWSYVAVQKPELPQPQRRFFGLLSVRPWTWAKTDIDHFIYQKLLDQNLQPSPQA